MEQKIHIIEQGKPEVLLLQMTFADHCTLVWEKGGHFVTPHLRLARAFGWCVNSLTK